LVSTELQTQHTQRLQVESELEMANNKIDAITKRIELREFVIMSSFVLPNIAARDRKIQVEGEYGWNCCREKEGTTGQRFERKHQNR